METTSTTIYQTVDQLDHDTEILLDQLILDLTSRGVDYADARASIRRVVKQV